jgi:hypothetical protein
LLNDKPEPIGPVMAEHSDFNGYYRILGVHQRASSEELKRAYRISAKQLHPDRHPNDPSATSKFQVLSEAYTVLCDPEARAEYDARCQKPVSQDAPRRPTDPVTCSSCGAVSAQPRYIVFWYVVSVLVSTTRKSFQGVFCSSCAPKKAIYASAITWLSGWWGFPWGPIWTVGALYRNLLNGFYPADTNAQILGRQAIYFWEKDKLALANACVDQALTFPSSPSLREHLRQLKAAIPSVPTEHLIDRWRLGRMWGFWAQCAILLGVVASMAWLDRDGIIAAVADHKVAHVVDTLGQIYAEPTPSAPILARIRPFADFDVLEGWGTTEYERVITSNQTIGYVARNLIVYGNGRADERGRCFPDGMPSLSNGLILKQLEFGPHTLKIVNGLGSDAVVKLRDVASHTVLSVYVRAGNEYSNDTIPEGNFVIEFATGREFSTVCGYFLSDMSSRRFESMQNFTIEFRGNSRYASAIDITLNPVAGGTARTLNTDDSVFDRD